MMAGGICYWVHLKRAVRNFIKIKGLVVCNEKHPHGCSEAPFRPVVEYQVSGHIFNVSGTQQYGQLVTGGTEITVLYNPQAPAESHIHAEYYWAAFALMGVGFIFLLIGLIML